MQRKTQIPDKPRLNYARQRAYQLLCELDIDRLPIDPWAVAKFFPSIHVLKWTELRENCHQSDPLSINAEGADAKTQLVRGSSDYLVVYDDRVASEGRVRWTIAHELGHIFLGHLVSFEATALCRGSLTEEQYRVLEREADTFAVNLLAPVTIVARIPFVKRKEDYIVLCGLSGEAAENCLRDLNLVKSGKSITFPLKEEDALHRQFFAFLCEVNQTKIPVSHCSDINLPGKYEDYVECEYWPFVMMAIRKWKLEKALYAALEGSLAIYDCDDMVIFVNGSNNAKCVTDGDAIILDALQKYAESSVRKITVLDVNCLNGK